MGFMIFLLAVVLAAILIPFGILAELIYNAIQFKLKGFKKRTRWYFLMFAVAIDQMGNVALARLLNITCIKKYWRQGYSFGHEDDTISKVLHYNMRQNALTKFGEWIYLTIEKIDPGHYDNIDRW
jgi:hypothetical protein